MRNSGEGIRISVCVKGISGVGQWITYEATRSYVLYLWITLLHIAKEVLPHHLLTRSLECKF